jgi:hypothetical protein
MGLFPHLGTSAVPIAASNPIIARIRTGVYADAPFAAGYCFMRSSMYTVFTINLRS